MAEIAQRCWLTFEGGNLHQPTLWQMSRQFPSVVFDIRQASLQEEIGIMSVRFQGEPDDLEQAFTYLREQGVKVDPVDEGG